MAAKKIIEHKKAKKKPKKIKRFADQENSDDCVKVKSDINTVIVVDENGIVTIQQKSEII